MEAFNDILIKYNVSYIAMPTIDANSILDILLVAYIIYNILIWVKETRAWSLLKGIFIILFISLISVLFKLYTMAWIIDKTLNAGIIAVIVLFTPEIRKALEQIGSTQNLFSFMGVENNDRQISHSSLDSVINACNKMAQVRTGAIIVIENLIPVGDIAETGVNIDGAISSQLLINIFEDKTPLHDGAVIIRNNKISAASCILPLTEKDIGQELGTRHRAAVGISEVSDAFVLVVSEESGYISLAYGGNLYKHADEEQIREIIKINNVENKKRLWKKGGAKNE